MTVFDIAQLWCYYYKVIITPKKAYYKGFAIFCQRGRRVLLQFPLGTSSCAQVNRQTAAPRPPRAACQPHLTTETTTGVYNIPPVVAVPVAIPVVAMRMTTAASENRPRHRVVRGRGRTRKRERRRGAQNLASAPKTPPGARGDGRTGKPSSIPSKTLLGAFSRV